MLAANLEDKETPPAPQERYRDNERHGDQRKAESSSPDGGGEN